MANLIRRIQKRMQSTYRAFRSDCHFSFWFACLRLLDELGGRIGMKRLSAWAHGRKENWIQDYLKQSLSPVLAEYQHCADPGVPVPDSPIWVCWWTGEDTAPVLVRQCIASIRRHAGNHPVQLITKDNFRDFLEIPPAILEKVQAGQICLANFSDYLRFSLLAKYGGLWLDATIFCSKQLPEDLFRMPIFTCKSPERECGYISRYRWTSFCFGGYRNGPLFRFMRDALDASWTRSGRSIDYLLVDHLIALAYSEIPEIRALMESIPVNNLHRDDLQAAMNEALPAEAFDRVIQDDTVLYKLSWREAYSKINSHGQRTIYDRFIGASTEE